MALSPPRRPIGIGALAEPWAKWLLPETKAAIPRALPAIKTSSVFKPYFSKSPKSFVAQIRHQKLVKQLEQRTYSVGSLAVLRYSRLTAAVADQRSLLMHRVLL